MLPAATGTLLRTASIVGAERFARRWAPHSSELCTSTQYGLSLVLSPQTPPGVRGLGKSARAGVLGAAPAEAGPRNSTGVTPAGLLLQEHACAARLQAGSSRYWGGAEVCMGGGRGLEVLAECQLATTRRSCSSRR